ncbi:MAG TPA: TolC family protein [Opitutaceae bacterium]|nr:TolC family protein [Opitutaceae bacterium]
MRAPATFACFVLLAAAGAGQEAAQPLTLDDAIRLALANNRTIKVDAYSRSIARANLLAAYGAFDPALGFTRNKSENYSLSLPSVDNGFLPPATLVRTDNYSLSFGGSLPWGLQYSLVGNAVNQRGSYNGFSNAFQTFGGVQVTQPLLRGFGLGGNAGLLGVRVAKADRAISDWQYRQTVIDTVTKVVVAYSNLALAHEYLRTTERYRDGAARLLAENEKRFKVGAISDNDVTSARARTALRDEGVLLATQAVRDSDNQLRLLLGEATFTNDGPLFAVEPLPPPDVTVNPVDDLKRAYRLRPDYQQGRLGITKSRYNEVYARNQLLPEVDFVGSYGYNGLDSDFAASRRMVTNQDNRSYFAGVQVTVPLTFAQGRGKARAARLQRQQAEAQLAQLEENIAVNVAAAANQIETARKRVAATHAAQKLNEELLQAELTRLRAGTGSTFSVLYQQDLLSQADTQYFQALADQRQAAAAYQQVIGTTLENYHVTLTDK